MLVLSAGWAMAQEEFESNPNSTFASRSASYRTTLEGCLDVQSGSYILALPAGSNVHLSGKPEQLSGHVGETVRISGIMTPLTNLPNASRAATETEPTLTVGVLEPISGVCRDYNNTR